MQKKYHILNGDVLKEQFPADIPGEIIVLRECLMDGPVMSNNIDGFYAIRAKFISLLDANFTESTHYEKTVPELEKISDIPDMSDLTLWFEDDLFCQVNFWFSISQVHQRNIDLFLVRPPQDTLYGFGGLDKVALKTAFEKRMAITDADKLALLWEFYRGNDSKNLLLTAHELRFKYPFIQHAVQVHIDRQPQGEFPGRPKATLKQIIKDLQTDRFDLIFQEFSKRESIYGYGDLQVKRLYNEVITKK
ncbi:DUF1835 domain-containing protein [Fulvivirga sp. 29W222]|uniref:DUF1835 domain-containing protein n=1 Tax=Fulvivirga marina TaxID=2494733 RepID=A0A937KAT0_9BACT|nr:DUF1835 domain-containing protein [Fulvivirga marina]MBL6445951.1 DUF1835 domain-containing protein [Fulvivirga marina]